MLPRHYRNRKLCATVSTDTFHLKGVNSFVYDEMELAVSPNNSSTAYSLKYLHHLRNCATMLLLTYFQTQGLFNDKGVKQVTNFVQAKQLLGLCIKPI